MVASSFDTPRLKQGASSMPELPEVETIRQSLDSRITGRQVTGVRVGDFHGVLNGDEPATFEARLRGRTITGTRRRGKYIILDLDDDSCVVIHLRMTGNLVLAPKSEPPLRFEHLAIELGDGYELRFSDQRKFGRVSHVLGDSSTLLEGKVGPEPLSSDFTAELLSGRLARRSAPIKSALLDQKLVAGIGNIYADEALFRARIHPLRPVNSLTPLEVRNLHRAIRQVLREGIVNRGASISHFRDGNGDEGANQSNLRVYGRGRHGEPCPRCGRPLTFLVIGGRSSHLCPHCQS
jgi:formamidopyrimidine-DNA glycosylase